MPKECMNQAYKHHVPYNQLWRCSQVISRCFKEWERYRPNQTDMEIVYLFWSGALRGVECKMQAKIRLIISMA